LEVLENNIDKFKLRQKCKILKTDIFKDKLYEELDNGFNLIFIDAPLKEKKIDLIIKNIKKNNLLKKNGIIILHRHASYEDNFSDDFKVIDYKKYGISKIIFGNYFWLNCFFVSTFINSTAGWLYGSIPKALPSIIVSSIK